MVVCGRSEPADSYGEYRITSLVLQQRAIKQQNILQATIA